MKRIDMTVHCSGCGVDYHLSVDYDGYVAWRRKEGFIQDLLQDNTDSERQLLISGTCGECFDKMFWYKEGENE
jgi:hypothetical protein